MAAAIVDCRTVGGNRKMSTACKKQAAQDHGAQEEHAAEKSSQSDRDLERLRHLILDRLKSLNDGVLRQFGELLELDNDRIGLLAGELVLQSHEIADRLRG
jgi:hypothetical protein